MACPVSSGSSTAATVVGFGTAPTRVRLNSLTACSKLPARRRGWLLLQSPTHHLVTLPATSSEAAPAAPPKAAPSPPSRWSLRAIQATFPWLHDLTLSGVWRVLQRFDLRLRSARLQHYSPDPEYVAKEAHLLGCLREAARAPGDELPLSFWMRWATTAGPRLRATGHPKHPRLVR